MASVLTNNTNTIRRANSPRDTRPSLPPLDIEKGSLLELKQRSPAIPSKFDGASSPKSPGSPRQPPPPSPHGRPHSQSSIDLDDPANRIEGIENDKSPNKLGKWQGIRGVLQRLGRESRSSTTGSHSRKSSLERELGGAGSLPYYEQARAIDERGPQDVEWEIPRLLLLAAYNFGYLSRRDYFEYSRVDALAVMKSGTAFLKFSKSGAPKFRLLKLSDDLRYLSYASPRKQREVFLDLRFGFRIVLGQSWSAFAKAPRALALISFSILTKDSTLDLVAKDTREYSIWTEGLTELARYLKEIKRDSYQAGDLPELNIRVPYFSEEINTSYLMPISRLCGPLSRLEFFNPSSLQDKPPPGGQSRESVNGRPPWVRVDLFGLFVEGTMFVCYYHGSKKQPKYMRLMLDTSLVSESNSSGVERDNTARSGSTERDRGSTSPSRSKSSDSDSRSRGSNHSRSHPNYSVVGSRNSSAGRSARITSVAHEINNIMGNYRLQLWEPVSVGEEPSGSPNKHKSPTKSKSFHHHHHHHHQQQQQQSINSNNNKTDYVLKFEFFLKDLLRIQIGQTTARFTRAETPRMLSQVSFSLVVRGDPVNSSASHSTVDLVAHSQDAFEVWTLGLQSLLRAYKSSKNGGSPATLEHLYVDVPMPRHRDGPSTKIGECIQATMHVKVHPTEVYLAVNPHLEDNVKTNAPGTTSWYDPPGTSPFIPSELNDQPGMPHMSFRESIDGFTTRTHNSVVGVLNNNNRSAKTSIDGDDISMEDHHSGRLKRMGSERDCDNPLNSGSGLGPSTGSTGLNNTTGPATAASSTGLTSPKTHDFQKRSSSPGPSTAPSTAPAPATPTFPAGPKRSSEPMFSSPDRGLGTIVLELPVMEPQDNSEIFQCDLRHSAKTKESSHLDSKGEKKDRYTMFFL